MKKILAIVLAVVMLLPVFAVNVFAAGDAFVLTNYPVDNKPVTFGEEGAKLKGWCPAVLVPWINGDACSTFKTALAKEGAVIEVVTDLKINGLTFQASPIDGKGGYPLVTLTSKLGEATADGKVTTTFSAKAYTDLVANSKYGGKDIPDEPMSFDHWNATGVNTPDNRDTTLYSFRVYVPETESETVVLVENKEFKSWEEIISGTSVDTLKSAMAKEGAVFEASYTTNGNKGWGYQLIFETNSITEGLTADGNKNTKTITSETLVKQLGSVDNISLFRSNYGVKKVTYNSIKVVKSNQVLVEYGERAPSTWGEICTGEELTEIKKALSEEGTALTIEYTTEGEGWGAQFIIETSGKTIGLEMNATDKVLKMTAAEFADACGGDVSHLARLRNNCDGGAGDTTTFNYIKVTVPASGKKKVSGNLAFVYVTDEYHAVLIGGRFLVMPHEEVLGYCPMCHAFIETEDAEPDPTADYGTPSEGPAGVYFKTSSGDNTLKVGDTLTVTFDGTVASEFCLKASYDADGTTNYCNLAIFGGAYKDWAFDGSEATKWFEAYGVNDGDVARLGMTAEFTEVEGGASTIVFTVTEASVKKFAVYGDVGNVGDSYGWGEFTIVE